MKKDRRKNNKNTLGSQETRATPKTRESRTQSTSFSNGGGGGRDYTAGTASVTRNSSYLYTEKTLNQAQTD